MGIFFAFAPHAIGIAKATGLHFLDRGIDGWNCGTAEFACPHQSRKPRATRLQETSAANRTRFHLPDGPEQQKRDQLMADSGDRSLANIGWLYQQPTGYRRFVG